MMDKNTLRKKMSEARKNIPGEIRRKKSLAITKRLVESDEYKTCKSVFCYLSYKTEAETDVFIKKALEDGKMVALPYVADKENMYFIEVGSLEGLVKNSYGIYEPAFDKSKIKTPTSDSLIIVPGLAFTKDGFRLGYGGGYYDRYLSKYSAKTIGICFEEQLVESLPLSTFDKRLDGVVFK